MDTQNLFNITTFKHYLALLRFNFRRIRTSDVSPGNELLDPNLLGDDLDRQARPLDATINIFV